MTRHIFASIRALLVLTILTGVIYPLFVTLVGQAVFPVQANGSLVQSVASDGTVTYTTDPAQAIGSTLVEQISTDLRYFWSRPSAVKAQQSEDGSVFTSGATNYAPTDARLAVAVAEREAAFREANNVPAEVPIPPDMLTASGSGLDPHISPEAARLQIERVAAARGLPAEQVTALVNRFTEPPQLGILGQPRVNVLLLNLALDATEAQAQTQ